MCRNRLAGSRHNINKKHLEWDWLLIANSENFPFKEDLKNLWEIYYQLAKRYFIFERVSKITQNIWGYLKLPFEIQNIHKELQNLSEKELLEYIPKYSFDLEKRRLMAEFYAKIQKAAQSKAYLLKLPLAVFLTKIVVQKWAKEQEIKRRENERLAVQKQVERYNDPLFLI